MQETVKQRLAKYLEYKKIGRNKFETLAGISLGYITNLKNAPKEQQLMKILQAAPDLNKVWLLTGEGEMLTTGSTAISGSAVASGNGIAVSGNHNDVNRTASDSEVLRERVAMLERLIEEKDKLLEEKERIIQIFMKR